MPEKDLLVEPMILKSLEILYFPMGYLKCRSISLLA